jgi:hypothetical protein
MNKDDLRKLKEIIARAEAEEAEEERLKFQSYLDRPLPNPFFDPPRNPFSDPPPFNPYRKWES